MLEYIFGCVLEISMAAGVFVLFWLYAFRKRMLRYSPHCRTILWMMVALRLLIPIQPDFRLTLLRLTAPYHLRGQMLAQPQSMSLMQMLAVIWVIGAILFLAAHLTAYKLFEHRMKQGQSTSSLSQEEYMEVRNLFYEVKYSLGIYDPIELWVSSEASGPMLLGFFRSKVVVPDLAMEREGTAMIFRHELLHHRRKDSWYRLLILAALSMHWFNPVIYLMARRSTEDLESACDRSAIRGKGSDFVEAYAQSLLQTARCLLQRKNVRQTVLVSYFSSSAKRLKKRLVDLFAPIPKKGLKLLVGAAAMVLFGSGMVFVQVNDQNLEWAENLRAGDISSVSFSSGAAQEQVDLSAQTKDNVVGWFSQISFKPALYQNKNRVEEERFKITKTDGSQKTVSLFSDGSVQVDGKDYRAYWGLIG